MEQQQPTASASSYLFPHHIVLGYITFWTVAELLAVRVWPIRVSCKKISLIHCILAFLFTSLCLVHLIFFDSNANILSTLSVPGTPEHHIISFSMAYFIVDMPFAIAFHQAFIVHHFLCIVAFAAIQGYWNYLPWPFYMDFMAWDTTNITSSLQDESDGQLQQQLLMGGLNGVFNLWMAELGGVFFHINRALKNTDMELPSRGLFLFMFTLSRCFLWPMYLWHLYLHSTTTPKTTHFHKASAVVETALFLTNIHFLYKNIAPIYKTGRMLPDKPKGWHRKWFDEHPAAQKIASLFLGKERISMPKVEDNEDSDSQKKKD